MKKRDINIIMFSNTEEDDKFHSSFNNENDSLNTFYSNENYNWIPYIKPSENEKYSLYDHNNSDLIFFRDSEDPNIFDSIIPDEKDIKYLKFNVLSKQRRGPKSNNELLGMKKHRHLNTNNDNLQIKIQVNFINFLINLSNDVVCSILKENKKYIFKDIDHTFKINVSHQNFDFLKSAKIKNILSIKISKKFTKFKNNQNINEQILNEVCQKSNQLNEFFNLNYLDVFKCCYYNDQNQMDKICFYGQIIALSEKTQKKTFYALLIKNKNIKNELINAVKNAYFNGKDPNCPMMDENRLESY